MSFSPKEKKKPYFQSSAETLEGLCHSVKLFSIKSTKLVTPAHITFSPSHLFIHISLRAGGGFSSMIKLKTLCSKNTNNENTILTRWAGTEHSERVS